MPAIPKDTRASVIACLRYRNAPAAIAWLCDTLGFTRQLVVPSGDGGIAHAQLSFGNGMIMLASVTDSAYGRLVTQPAQLDNAATQSCYLVVSDADLVYQRVRASGAAIELEIKDEDYGGRGFTCRDPEGHLWSLGTYDPWRTTQP